MPELKKTAAEISQHIQAIFQSLEAKDRLDATGGLAVKAPATGEVIASLEHDTGSSANLKINGAASAQGQWATVSQAERGEFLNFLSARLEEHKDSFSALITYEGGKKPKGADLETGRAYGVFKDTVKQATQADLAVPTGENLAREKVRTPVGTVGLITSYNFPLAVAAWNIAPALLAGNAVVWKPSEKTPLTALAFKGLFDKAVFDFNQTKGKKIVPPGLLKVLVGERDIGEALVKHEQVDLVSATGSSGMGRGIREAWAKKKNNEIQPILELGGNNAVIISKNCDAETLEFAVNAILNSVFQSGGQFCTNTRRLIIHEDVYDVVIDKLRKKFETYIGSGAIANPLLGDVAGDNQHYAPLIDKAALEQFNQALEQAKKEGGTIVFGQRVLQTEYPDATYVQPAIAEMKEGAALDPKGIMQKETFAPVLFVTKYKGDIDNVIEMVNAPTNARLVNGLYTQSAEEIEIAKRDIKSGDLVINSKIGTIGPMRSGLGFGGSEESGQGIVLDASDPLHPFTKAEKVRRVTRNTNITLNS